MAVGKGNEPTAPRNEREHTIATKVLAAGVNEQRAWAHVAGWIGSERHLQRWVDDVISVTFQFELDFLRAEAAKERPAEITWLPDGTPRIRLLEPRDEQEVLAKLAALKRGAPAAVVEEATTRVICKLLGIEWRSREEIELAHDYPDVFE